MPKTEKEFRIPINFSQLIFQQIQAINTPQRQGSYAFRIFRLHEVLLPFADEQYLEESKKIVDKWEQKAIDNPKLNHPVNIGPRQYEVCHMLYPKLIALCQRIEIIEFKTKKVRKI